MYTLKYPGRKLPTTPNVASDPRSVTCPRPQAATAHLICCYALDLSFFSETCTKNSTLSSALAYWLYVFALLFYGCFRVCGIIFFMLLSLQVVSHNLAYKNLPSMSQPNLYAVVSDLPVTHTSYVINPKICCDNFGSNSQLLFKEMETATNISSIFMSWPLLMLRIPMPVSSGIICFQPNTLPPTSLHCQSADDKFRGFCMSARHIGKAFSLATEC